MVQQWIVHVQLITLPHFEPDGFLTSRAASKGNKKNKTLLLWRTRHHPERDKEPLQLSLHFRSARGNHTMQARSASKQLRVSSPAVPCTNSSSVGQSRVLRWERTTVADKSLSRAHKTSLCYQRWTAVQSSLCYLKDKQLLCTHTHCYLSLMLAWPSQHRKLTVPQMIGTLG